MVEKKDVDKMIKRFLEEGLIEKLDEFCYSFTPKAKIITKTPAAGISSAAGNEPSMKRNNVV